MRLERLLVAIWLGMTAVPAADAQLSGAVDLGGGMSRLGSGNWQRQSDFIPTVLAMNRAGYIRFEGVGTQRDGSVSLRRSKTEALITSPAFGVFRLTVAGQYSADATDPVARTTSGSLTSALSARLGSGGLWLGAQNASSLSAGAWHMLGNAILSVSSHDQQQRIGGRPASLREVITMDSVYTDTSGWNHFPVTRTYGDSGSPSRLRSWSQLEARVDWSVGRLLLAAAMSGRPAGDSMPAMRWGRLSAVVQLGSRLSLIAAAGTMPSARVSIASSRYATLGLRFSPARLLRPPLPASVRPSASAFTVRPSTNGMYLLTVRVPGARTVEISGDFNQWSPIALRETSFDVWEIALPLSPGTHRVNLRVDGDKWTAPPGVAAVDDEFSGRVGIFVVR